jgi:hypothetical protein
MMPHRSGAATVKQARNAAPSDSTAHRTLKQRALEEFKKYLLITFYLWILFALLAEYKRVLLQENGINLWNQGYAIVNALIFGKVVLLGEALRIGDGMKNQALIWSVLWRALLFTALLVVFHIAEETVRAWIHHAPVAESVTNFGGGTWRGFMTYAALVFVALVPLLAFREASDAIGRDALWNLLFSRDRNLWRQPR